MFLHHTKGMVFRSFEETSLYSDLGSYSINFWWLVNRGWELVVWWGLS